MTVNGRSTLEGIFFSDHGFIESRPKNKEVLGDSAARTIA